MPWIRPALLATSLAAPAALVVPISGRGHLASRSWFGALVSLAVRLNVGAGADCYRRPDRLLLGLYFGRVDMSSCAFVDIMIAFRC